MTRKEKSQYVLYLSIIIGLPILLYKELKHHASL